MFTDGNNPVWRKKKRVHGEGMLKDELEKVKERGGSIA